MYGEHAQLEHDLNEAAEQMDAIGQIRDAWRSLPPDVRQAILRQVGLVWELRGAYAARLIATVNALLLGDPALRRALLANPHATIPNLAARAGQIARLPPKRSARGRPGFSDVQVREHRRRQIERGGVPGRDQRMRRYREMEGELALEHLEHELEMAADRLSVAEGEARWAF